VPRRTVGMVVLATHVPMMLTERTALSIDWTSMQASLSE
jgi:hypothetical protein